MFEDQLTQRQRIRLESLSQSINACAALGLAQRAQPEEGPGSELPAADWRLKCTLDVAATIEQFIWRADSRPLNDHDDEPGQLQDAMRRSNPLRRAPGGVTFVP